MNEFLKLSVKKLFRDLSGELTNTLPNKLSDKKFNKIPNELKSKNSK